MGMILGFFLLVYILVAVGVYKFTKRFSRTKWMHHIVLSMLILIPTYDIIITNVLATYYCLATPSTYVNKKVQYPQSIYWEDNVYPGFTKEDRKLMIINYLDGEYLKTIALNGDDGKIYLYHLERPMWEQIKKEFNAKKYKDIYDQYAQTIMDKSQVVYTKETMPKMNYTVTFDEVKLNPFSRKFLYSDETKIIDNNTSEVIAYNRKYMRFFYNIAPDFVMGNRYYSSWAWEICKSDSHLYYDGDGFKYILNYGSAKHMVSLNVKLYNKYAKGEK